MVCKFQAIDPGTFTADSLHIRRYTKRCSTVYNMSLEDVLDSNELAAFKPLLVQAGFGDVSFLLRLSSVEIDEMINSIENNDLNINVNLATRFKLKRRINEYKQTINQKTHLQESNQTFLQSQPLQSSQMQPISMQQFQNAALISTQAQGQAQAQTQQNFAMQTTNQVQQFNIMNSNANGLNASLQNQNNSNQMNNDSNQPNNNLNMFEMQQTSNISNNPNININNNNINNNSATMHSPLHSPQLMANIANDNNSFGINQNSPHNFNTPAFNLNSNLNAMNSSTNNNNNNIINSNNNISNSFANGQYQNNDLNNNFNNAITNFNTNNSNNSNFNNTNNQQFFGASTINNEYSNQFGAFANLTNNNQNFAMQTNFGGNQFFPQSSDFPTYYNDQPQNGLMRLPSMQNMINFNNNNNNNNNNGNFNNNDNNNNNDAIDSETVSFKRRKQKTFAASEMNFAKTSIKQLLFFQGLNELCFEKYHYLCCFAMSLLILIISLTLFLIALQTNDNIASGESGNNGASVNNSDFKNQHLWVFIEVVYILGFALSPFLCIIGICIVIKQNDSQNG